MSAVDQLTESPTADTASGDPLELLPLPASRASRTPSRASARTEGPGRESSGTEEAERFRRELAEALEQQTATAGILRVISASPTNVQLVLDAVARSTNRGFSTRLDYAVQAIKEIPYGR